MGYASVFSQDGQAGHSCKTPDRYGEGGGGYHPFRQDLRRQSTAYLIVIYEQVDEMMKHGMMEPAHAEWASNVVRVRRGEEILRFCVD